MRTKREEISKPRALTACEKIREVETVELLEGQAMGAGSLSVGPGNNKSANYTIVTRALLALAPHDDQRATIVFFFDDRRHTRLYRMGAIRRPQCVAHACESG